MLDQSILFWGLLCLTGLAAGIINTLAGGGSNLTLPVLMMMGLPADVANGTNRVGVLLQCLVASRGFRQHDQLPTEDLPMILALTIGGGLIGAVLAAYLPVTWLKPMLLLAMIVMAVVILVRPAVVMPESGTPVRQVAATPASWPVLLIAGIYGGFVQAGVGFILIAALAGSLRYDLLKSNALKVVCTLAFTLVALVLFVLEDQVAWLPGLILASGSMLGAHLAVKWAIRIEQKVLKWLLLLMTLVAAGAAMLTN